MNFKYIALLLVSSVCFLASCDNDSENALSQPSKDSQILSFSVTGVHDKTIKDSLERATDSLRFVTLGKTKFAIDQLKGQIFNTDSLPFGTVLGNLAVKVSYKGNPHQISVQIPDSTYNWNSSDSINFSKNPITFTVSAGEGTKEYNIKLLIHKIDPDLLTWKQVGSLTKAVNQKTVLFNEKFYSFTQTSTGIPSVEIISSGNGTISSEEKAVSGLPFNANAESITLLNNIFYSISNSGDSYKSEDGVTWIRQANEKIFLNILGVIPGSKATDDQLLVITNDAGQFYFGYSKDLSSVDQLTKIPDNFPTKRFTSVTNYSRNKKNNMLLISAGLDKNDKMLSATWWLSLDENGIFQINPSKGTDLFKGGGLSSFFYDNKLYTFAGKEFFISNDWGINWTKAPEKQALNSNFGSRYLQSVIVKDKNIWIFGGVSESGFYFKDIWSGILNRVK